ncbi:IQ calmodulin-binding protein, putative [Bodo saltans]|uniref:IQ calmodulin-binding protein, putative n=1 Tax=Bodo saltans TaxID=75058 RepID=A0A0S4KKC2_BODSA|nr:IQ calmodulin-binding protein, putative [Bodo saltans]|eukprot:CUI15454.1 IQ calmodulin-binding protein, putative [Bodo saltans]
MPTAESLERDQEIARVARELLEKRIFTLYVQWFSETSATVRREAKSRTVLAPYAKQLHDISRQQTLFREESHSRRSITQIEKRHVLEMVMLHKYQVLLSTHWDDMNNMLFQVIQLPQAVRVGVTMLEDHAAFRTQVLQEERHARYQLRLQSRVAYKAALLATERGNLERDEQHFRDHVLVEWEVDTIARYREFRLEDSIFQLERHIIDQSNIRQAETAGREEILRSQSDDFFGSLLSADALDAFANYHAMYLHGIIGSEFVNILFREMMIIKLEHVIREEDEARLYQLLVEEGNAFHRAHDALQEKYTQFRREQATRRLQRWSATIIAKQFVEGKSFRASRSIERRIADEEDEHHTKIRANKFHAMQDVIAPFLWTRLSVRERHEKRRHSLAKLVAPIAKGFQLRREFGALFHEVRIGDEIELQQATYHAATLFQRLGRGCLAREEVCDVALEEVCDVALEASENAYHALQHQHIAALAIQWAWKELMLRRRTELEKIRAVEMHKKIAAAIKIQALFRRARVRDFYTLLLVPRHRNKTAAFIQRMMRGAQVRRTVHHHKLATMVQRYILAFRSRRVVTEQRLTPHALTIQCMARSTAARKRFAKLDIARNAKELHTAKNSYIVMIQALFRGYTIRKRNREAARIALQVRLTMLECDSAYLEDDMWRIGRGFIARRQLAQKQQVKRRQLMSVQAAMRAVLSQNRRLVLEEICVEDLCRKITVVRVATIQGILQQRISNTLVDRMRVEQATRDKYVNTFQKLIGRCREGYRARTEVGDQYLRRCGAALNLHRIISGYLSRSTSGQELIVFRERQRCAARNTAASSIQRVFRCHAYRRRIAALVLQRSLILRFWSRLKKRSEVSIERRKLHSLHRQSLCRYENTLRSELSTDESTLRTLITSNINTADWCRARSQYLNTLPSVEIPDALWMLMKRKRLTVEEESLTWLVATREQMRREHRMAQEATQLRQFTQNIRGCETSEAVLRQRLIIGQLECRRAISIAVFTNIENMFKVKRSALERAQSADREMIVQEWQGEADVGLEKAYNALLGLLARSAVDFQIACASHKESGEDSTATDMQSMSPRVAAAQKFTVPPQPAAATRASSLPPSSSLRRKFALPQDTDAPQSNINDDDLSNIFGSILRRASSTKLAAADRDASVAQRPSSGPTKPPRVLPPIPSVSAALSILQPQLPGQSESSLAYDVHLLREKARDDIIFTAEGIVDSSALGPGLTDETISVVETFIRTRIVTGLVLPRSTVSVRSILHLLRVARVSKSPLVVVDVSQNEVLDDVVGNHLIDLIDIMSTLMDVKVSGTAISPAKRLLMFHTLEQKKMGGGLLGVPARRDASSVTPTPLAPVRFARQLQLPRRNGWATHFKDYGVETKAGVADRIFERLMNAKPDEPQW